MQEFGKKGLEAIELGMLSFAATLYWFTVEFGLISTNEGLRIYGAGITSSPAESLYALESAAPVRVKFNMQRLMRTKYHVDSFQKTYFVVKSYEELFHAVRNLDWHKLSETYHFFTEIDQGVVIESEEIFQI